MHRTAFGFTLIEVLLVVAIGALLATLSMQGIRAYGDMQELRSAEQDLILLFRDTRQKTVAAESSVPYGLQVATSSVTRFIGATFDPATTTNEQFEYAGIQLNAALADGTNEVTFARLTGAPSATGTIDVEHTRSGAVRTLRIAPTGHVERE